MNNEIEKEKSKMKTLATINSIINGIEALAILGIIIMLIVALIGGGGVIAQWLGLGQGRLNIDLLIIVGIILIPIIIILFKVGALLIPAVIIIWSVVDTRKNLDNENYGSYVVIGNVILTIAEIIPILFYIETDGFSIFKDLRVLIYIAVIVLLRLLVSINTISIGNIKKRIKEINKNATNMDSEKESKVIKER